MIAQIFKNSIGWLENTFKGFCYSLQEQKDIETIIMGDMMKDIEIKSGSL